MKGKGFEVLVKDGSGKIIIDRAVGSIIDGKIWAKDYTKGEFSEGKEATLYIDGKPQITYYGIRRKRE